MIFLQGYSLSKDLDESQKWDLRVYIALVNNVLLNAEVCSIITFSIYHNDDNIKFFNLI